jgi:hypothetical protein
MFHEHERYQAHCQYCQKTVEGDSAAKSIELVEAHERECPNMPKLFISAPSAPSFCITDKDAREIVRITPEGEVIINPCFTTDEAAHAFWKAVQKMAAQHRAGRNAGTGVSQ